MTKAPEEIFAANLKALRHEKRMVQREVAKALCVDIKRYQAWEEKRSSPPMFIALRIANHYKRTLEHLLTQEI